MRIQRRRLAIACLLSLCFVTHPAAQDGSRKTPPKTKDQSALRLPNTALMSPEEKLIRAAYEKLSLLNRASLLLKSARAGQARDEGQTLQFSLGNFRVGPISEIWGALHSEIKTGVSGEIIEVERSITRLNQGEERVAYRAQWGTGHYSSGYDRRWTVGDLLSLEPDLYHDVGEYASYDVTVSYMDKTRAYRALALFRNPYGFAGMLRPVFWDSIVGMGGALNDVWNENRNPVGWQKRPAAIRGASSRVSQPAVSSNNSHGDGQLFKASLTDSSPSAIVLGSIVRTTTQDTTEHTKGAHGETVGFRGSCTEMGLDDQLCQVTITDTADFENGQLSNWLYYHGVRRDEKAETATGPRGTSINCLAGRGIAIKRCLSSDCNFTASLSLSGGGVQMTGGDVWNGQLMHRHSCNMPVRPRAKCAIAGLGGMCPIGTYPDGSGMCCSGDCSGFQSGTPDASLSLAPPDPEASFAPGETCNSDYYWDGCQCFPISPVLIDVAGDGFRLTGAEGGVSFDINGDGVAEQISWTSGNADDAWLVLDRNGNGVVDGGQELFGNFTPQPAPPSGEERNGFLALAVYDRAGNGGNGDGTIDARDPIFNSLRLWQDANHNGVSEAAELRTLAALGLVGIEVSYKESKQTDEHGNRFRYRAKVADAKGAKVGRWAWDVFLVKMP